MCEGFCYQFIYNHFSSCANHGVHVLCANVQAGLEEDTFVPKNGTYIASSYVKLVESGGARVVPILADTPADVVSAEGLTFNRVLC